MDHFTGTIRGDGLRRVQNALAVLADDQQQLNGARLRFETTPPPYDSQPSGTTTRSESPELLTDEEKRNREKWSKLRYQYLASTPSSQFNQQVSEEARRLQEAWMKNTLRLEIGESFDSVASERVMKQWREQGIWNDLWNDKRTRPSGYWEHEETFHTESDEETNPEAPPLQFSSSQPKVKRLKSEDARQEIAKRRITREREREASRPYNQFIYQLSKERERMQDEFIGSKDRFADDVNTNAYEVVKQKWEKRRIWNETWGVMPGMSWLCEKQWPKVLEENGLATRASTEASSGVRSDLAAPKSPFPRSSSVNGATVQKSGKPSSHSLLRDKSTRSKEPCLSLDGTLSTASIDQDVIGKTSQRRSPRLQRSQIEPKQEKNGLVSQAHRERNGTRKAKARSLTKSEGVSKKQKPGKTLKTSRTKAK